MNTSRKLVGTVCTTLLIFGLWGRAGSGPASSDPVDPYIKGLLSALTGLVDEKLAHVNHTLELLAQSSEVRSGEWEKMRGELRKK